MPISRSVNVQNSLNNDASREKLMRKVNFLMCGLLSLYITQTKAEITQANLIRADSSKLDYYLNTSAENTNNLLILIQGSDCNSVFYNKNINQTFSNVLDDKDVLTIEKYGINKQLPWDNNAERIDCPQDYLDHDSPSQRVSDIKQVLESLLERKKYERVVVLGGSEGALIANMLSANSTYITHTVALNGGGKWFLDDVLHNIKQTTPDDSYESVKQGFMGFKQHILSGPISPLNVSGHGNNWWRDMLTTDQTQYLKQIRHPILIIQSAKDVSVSPQLAFQQAQALMSLKNNIEYKVYDELDHGFVTTDGASQSNLVVNDIKAWLSSIKGQMKP
jgi:pimeloyl-ACP methyl ester carboxylesterase